MISEIEKYALENKIPIMQKDGILFMIDFIKKNKIKKILEIGSAIGYSSICMASISSDIKVTTIERDIKRYSIAIDNIKKSNLDNQITVINDDAFNINITDKYDLIFIDAAKSQSIKFFLKFSQNLNKHGFIITDNIYFHGLTFTNEKLSKNLRQLTNKIKDYVKFLEENKEFITDIIDVGDGISISTRRSK